MPRRSKQQQLEKKVQEHARHTKRGKGGKVYREIVCLLNFNETSNFDWKKPPPGIATHTFTRETDLVIVKSVLLWDPKRSLPVPTRKRNLSHLRVDFPTQEELNNHSAKVPSYVYNDVPKGGDDVEWNKHLFQSTSWKDTKSKDGGVITRDLQEGSSCFFAFNRYSKRELPFVQRGITKQHPRTNFSLFVHVQPKFFKSLSVSVIMMIGPNGYIGMFNAAAKNGEMETVPELTALERSIVLLEVFFAACRNRDLILFTSLLPNAKEIALRLGEHQQYQTHTGEMAALMQKHLKHPSLNQDLAYTYIELGEAAELKGDLPSAANWYFQATEATQRGWTAPAMIQHVYIAYGLSLKKMNFFSSAFGVYLKGYSYGSGDLESMDVFKVNLQACIDSQHEQRVFGTNKGENEYNKATWYKPEQLEELCVRQECKKRVLQKARVTCPHCERPTYCSTECQRKEWSKHEKDCRSWAKLVQGNRALKMTRSIKKVDFDEMEQLANQAIAKGKFKRAIRLLSLAIPSLEETLGPRDKFDQIDIESLNLSSPASLSAKTSKIQPELENQLRRLLIARARAMLHFPSLYKKTILNDCFAALASKSELPFDDDDLDFLFATIERMRKADEKVESTAVSQEEASKSFLPDHLKTTSSRGRGRGRGKRGRGRKGGQKGPVEEAPPPKKEKKADIRLSSTLHEQTLSTNTKHEDDYCPICLDVWKGFIDPSLVVVLPCSHAVCAPCLSQFRDETKESFEVETVAENEDEVYVEDAKMAFGCPLCRAKLPKNLMLTLGEEVMKKQMVESLTLLMGLLDFGGERGSDIVLSLLLKHHFNVNKVESILFTMVGYATMQKSQAATTIPATTEEKQAIFETARGPVEKLQEEYQVLCEELSQVFDDSLQKWRQAHQKLQKIRAELKGARENAAKDIFERTNQKQQQQSQQKNLHCVDLHGLYVKEACELCDEFVLPTLSVLGKIGVITGWGRHASSGTSVLREKVKAYLEEKGVKVVISSTNPGLLLLSA